MSAETPEEQYNDEDDRPCIALVVVDEVVADKARYDAEHADDDDADHEWKRAGVDGRKCLPSEDDCCHREPEPLREQVRQDGISRRARNPDSLRKDVQDGVDGSSDISRAEPRDDHCAEPRLRAKGTDKCCGHSTQRAKAENGGDSMSGGQL